MDIRKCKAEVNYYNTATETSLRMGPGMDVDLDQVVEKKTGKRVRDLVNEDCFEPKAEPEPQLEKKSKKSKTDEDA